MIQQYRRQAKTLVQQAITTLDEGSADLLAGSTIVVSDSGK
jgi:hypothetical protein